MHRSGCGAAVSVPTRDNLATREVENPGLLMSAALLGTLAIEAGLVAQALSAFQNRVGDMLVKPELDDDDIAHLQMLDQLTQRVADLAAVLDTAGQGVDTRDRLTVRPLLLSAKLAHTKTLIHGLDLTRPLGQDNGAAAECQDAEDVTLF